MVIFEFTTALFEANHGYASIHLLDRIDLNLLPGDLRVIVEQQRQFRFARDLYEKFRQILPLDRGEPGRQNRGNRGSRGPGMPTEFNYDAMLNITDVRDYIEPAIAADLN